MTCEICHSPLRRSQRTTLVSYWMSCFCLFPYRCSRCGRRTTRMHLEQASLFYSVVVLCLAVLVTGAAWYRSRHRAAPPRAAFTAPQSGRDGAAPSSENVMTNQDIIDLTDAGMESYVLTKLIRTSPHNFRIDTKSLIELKQEGTPDDVIGAMIESTPVPQSANGAEVNPVISRLAVRPVQ